MAAPDEKITATKLAEVFRKDPSDEVLVAAVSLVGSGKPCQTKEYRDQYSGEMYTVVDWEGDCDQAIWDEALKQEEHTATATGTSEE